MMEFHRQPNTFVDLVNIKVSDLSRALTFYQGIIGFQVLERSERSATLTANGRTPLLVIEQPVPVIAKQPRTTGLYHFALLLPSRADLGRFLNHLLQSGYPLQGASDHLVSEAIYFADPDGNGVEVYADRPSSSWDWSNGEVKMSTEPIHAENLLAEGKDEPWTALPPETILGHIHLHVANLFEAETFYIEGLGFNVVARLGNQALFISTGNYHHHIGLNTWNGVGAPTPPEHSVGLKWFSLTYPSEEVRAKTVNRLETIGFQVERKHGEEWVIDPSGNHIRLLVDAS
jgi:catechol 2,3-dioxygenase